MAAAAGGRTVPTVRKEVGQATVTIAGGVEATQLLAVEEVESNLVVAMTEAAAEEKCTPVIARLFRARAQTTRGEVMEVDLVLASRRAPMSSVEAEVPTDPPSADAGGSPLFTRLLHHFLTATCLLTRIHLNGCELE